MNFGSRISWVNIFIAFALHKENGVDEISKDLPSCQEYLPSKPNSNLFNNFPIVNTAKKSISITKLIKMNKRHRDTNTDGNRIPYVTHARICNPQTYPDMRQNK
jgi:hypothetical protein